MDNNAQHRTSYNGCSYGLEIGGLNMRINVKVHPRSRRVKLVFNDVLDVYLTEPPEDNRANKQLEGVLSDELKCNAKIVHGFKSRNKIVLLDISEAEYLEAKKGIADAEIS